MATYIVRRLLIMLPTLFLITVFGFALMELPPGDYVTSYVNRQVLQGNTNAIEQADELREQFGMNDPIVARFLKWLGNFASGDFGDSFEHRRPVREVIADRLVSTLLVSTAAFLLSWGIGIPLGIYSATHQYSKTDNILTTITFIGLGLPDFVVALFLLIVTWKLTGEVVTGLYSSEFVNAPWSMAKLVDFLQHLWLPVLAVVFSGTAWVMRVMRGNLLDELGKNYIVAIRAKGVPERVVIYKHAVRNALHPLIASLGQTLAFLISGFVITSAVLDLPTVQAVYLSATMQQDVYLAGAILVLIGALVLIGNLIADILLAWLDPRIRYN